MNPGADSNRQFTMELPDSLVSGVMDAAFGPK